MRVGHRCKTRLLPIRPIARRSRACRLCKKAEGSATTAAIHTSRRREQVSGLGVCEGIVSKRLGSLYRSGRSVKVKNPNAPAIK